MGKPSTKKKSKSFGQNQGLVWFSDSSLWVTNYLEEKLRVLDRTKALYDPQTQAYGETNHLKEKIQVLDRTKTLYGSRTQAYGETNYLEEKLQVLDRTKVLYGPRTQTYGETNYLKEKQYKFWTEPRPCMVLGLKPMRKPTT